MSKTGDILSPRKRSPRKQLRRPVKKASDGNKRTTSNSQRKLSEQKTLQHFFNKQQERSKIIESLNCNGSQGLPLIIDDSDDESSASSREQRRPTPIRDLFTSPSPAQKTQSGTAPIPSQQVLEQDTDIARIGEPSLNIDDDSDNLKTELSATPEKQKHDWTPEADTFRILLEKVRLYKLLEEDDNALLDRFEKLSKQAREICLRLYQRKHKWIPRIKISYKLNDIDSSLAEAVAQDFLYDKRRLNDISTLLNLLQLKDVVELARKFCHLRGISTKSGAIEALLSHCDRKDLLFGQERIRRKILESSQELLEQCFYVSPAFAGSVTRVLTLFSLGNHFDTFGTAIDRNDHGCCSLYSIGQYLGGFFTLPDHETENIFNCIFKSSRDFKLFCEARVRHFQLLRLIESNNHDEAVKRFEEHFAWFVSNYSVERFLDDASLPQFLQRFTFSYLLLKFFSMGADVLERQRRYDEAVDLHFTILSQNVFLLNRRGQCWNRLLLDIDAHLKKPRNSLALAHLALRDSIFIQQKYDIFTRAERLSKRFELKKKLPNLQMPIEAPVETIDGHLIQRSILGRKNVFASVDSDGERVVGPEALALQHYLSSGFTRGVHGETPAILMLLSLVCWDIVFGNASENQPETPKLRAVRLTKECEIEIINRIFTVIDTRAQNDEGNAKHLKRKRGAKRHSIVKSTVQPVSPIEHNSRYYDSLRFPTIEENPERKHRTLQRSVCVAEFQSGPLDLGYPEFYLNRKRAIDEHLQQLSRTSSAEIARRASAEYEKRNGTVNSLFSWEVFTKEEVEGLLLCIPVDVLVGIFRKLLIDFRFYRSGFPDIIMWNESDHTWKVVEVKGPGDTLSTKQRYWMHHLLSLGVNCVTCRVKSVHNKKIITTLTT